MTKHDGNHDVAMSFTHPFLQYAKKSTAYSKITIPSSKQKTEGALLYGFISRKPVKRQPYVIATN